MMTKEDLRLRLGDVTVLDVRSDRDWDKAARMIPYAVREEPGDVERWAGKYRRDEPLVLYCSSPQERMSTHVALRLKAMGYAETVVLRGGWREWAGSKYPTVPKGAAPAETGERRAS